MEREKLTHVVNKAVEDLFGALTDKTYEPTRINVTAGYSYKVGHWARASATVKVFGSSSLAIGEEIPTEPLFVKRAR